MKYLCFGLLSENVTSYLLTGLSYGIDETVIFLLSRILVISIVFNTDHVYVLRRVYVRVILYY